MNLFDTFNTSANAHPENTALVIEEKEYSYLELKDIISRISFVLSKFTFQNVAIFSSRSLSAYSGILATLQTGKTYIPLNPKFPEIRNQLIIRLAQTKILIVDKSCITQLEKIADDVDPETVILTPEIQAEEISEVISNRFSVFSKENFSEKSFFVKEKGKEDHAYIMFTSGTTGIPKGVPVSHGNVFSYIKYQSQRYAVRPDDRFSQTFDITFDLSVHDMFLAWNGAASLYVIPERILMAPSKFIRENRLTMWFSVPSLAQFMAKFRMLKPEVFPHLRYSLFCGEPLPKVIAATWQKAAPGSILENIYGPTEATIGITHYQLPKDEDLILEKNGIVSIGNIFLGQDYCLINEEGEKEKDEGELCLSGSQLTLGYWENPEKTQEQFFSFEGEEKLWYKTGDIVQEINNNLFYKSRKDFQVKVRGYRIELDEINLAISKFTGTDLICTIPFPVIDGVANNLYSFVDKSCSKDKAEIIKQLSSILPEYMIPKEVILLEEFPLNSNGKIDRKKLYQSLT